MSEDIFWHEGEGAGEGGMKKKIDIGNQYGICVTVKMNGTPYQELSSEELHTRNLERVACLLAVEGIFHNPIDCHFLS